MSDLIKRLDFWLTIGAIGFFVMLEFDKIRTWWSGRSVKRLDRRERAIMSRGAGSRFDRAGADTGSAPLVPRQQNQAAPELVPDFGGVITFLSRHNNAAPDDLIDVLSVLQRPDGEYLLSANKIREIVGGNEAAVKARVAGHRPKAAAAKPAARLERPASGW